MNHHPFDPGLAGCRVTLSLPASVVHRLVRLAELTGRSLNDELLRVLALYLEAWHTVGDELDHLFALERGEEPWEKLAPTLPGWALTALFDLAGRHGATPDQALAIMLRGATKSLLAAEGIALVENKRFPEAFLDMVARDLA